MKEKNIEKGEHMPTIIDRIKTIDKTICRHLDNVDGKTRGIISQDVIAHLIAFVEHIMLNFYSHNRDIPNTEDNIQKGIEYAQTTSELKELYRFHKYLNIVAIHYSLDEDSSERLMLKYYKYLLTIQTIVRKSWGLEILHNLDKFPLNTDTSLEEYYKKISEKLEMYDTELSANGDTYYIQKLKSFFVNKNHYYEVTFTPAMGRTSKSHRVIAFTKIPIISNYASKFRIQETSIEVLGKTMPIALIVGWEVAIRECEFNNFASLLKGPDIKIPYSERRIICSFLTKSQYTLSELMDFPEYAYQQITFYWRSNLKSSVFIDRLDQCRKIILKKLPGQNLLRYLLFNLNNEIIKSQRDRKWNQNSRLSNLYLRYESIPFDDLPFVRSPKDHNPRLGALFSCIPKTGREPELFARFITNNAEIQGHIFTAVDEITRYKDIPNLVNSYNSSLYYKHYDRGRLIIEKGEIYINEYKEDTCTVIKKLKAISKFGLENYASNIESFLDLGLLEVDCDEKKKILKQLFADSKVALVYGSAGVGKTTLIKHVADYFSDVDNLFLTQTNSAKNNLETRVKAENSTFSTIASFISKNSFVNPNCELLIIDECSTVSNSDMVEILKRSEFNLILLVGDTYQISSIRFGNWFTAIRSFIPAKSVHELTTPYRTENQELLNLWAKVRRMDDDTQELIDMQSCSLKVDETLLSGIGKNEVILCLNYDGLYGINNINRFLQESNTNPAIQWGIQYYKVGDPVLFLESNRFQTVIYNNMKGTIVGIKINDEGKMSENIQFDIELSEEIDEEEARWYSELQVLDKSDSGNSVVRFSVYKTKSYDEDDDPLRTIVPFQVAYAISIHKSQGLEYNTVKLVITDEVDEMVTHNIFYTAITRARKQLKIYWTPEVEHKIISRIKPRDIERDIKLLEYYLEAEKTDDKLMIL